MPFTILTELLSWILQSQGDWYGRSLLAPAGLTQGLWACMESSPFSERGMLERLWRRSPPAVRPPSEAEPLKASADEPASDDGESEPELADPERAQAEAAHLNHGIHGILRHRLGAHPSRIRL